MKEAQLPVAGAEAGPGARGRQYEADGQRCPCGYATGAPPLQSVTAKQGVWRGFAPATAKGNRL